MIVGAVPSVMVTVCVAVDVLPNASVDVYVTVVTPTGNVVGASLVTATIPSTKSEAVAAFNVTGVRLAVASVLTSAGALITGAVVSATITACVCVDVLPALSVDVYVTVVVPTENVAGASFVTVTVPSTKSVALAKPSATALLTLPASTLMFAGALITGAVVSPTIIFCVVVELSPLASVAVHVTTVVPTGNVAGASLVTVTAKKSVAFGEESGTEVNIPLASETIFKSGVAWNTGAVVSCT